DGRNRLWLHGPKVHFIGNFYSWSVKSCLAERRQGTLPPMVHGFVGRWAGGSVNPCLPLIGLGVGRKRAAVGERHGPDCSRDYGGALPAFSGALWSIRDGRPRAAARAARALPAGRRDPVGRGPSPLTSTGGQPPVPRGHPLWKR